jgi:hypothetical protein
VSDPGPDTAWPPSENDEYDPTLPLTPNRLRHPSRAFVAAVILVIVFAIVATLTAIGISRLGRVERGPSPHEETSTPPKQPDGPSVEPAEPPEPYKSLVLDAARSYLLANANERTETEIDRLRLCLFIEDGYKQRLDCYDSVVAPDPKPKPPVAKLVADCKFLKEEDARLGCFNRFLEQPEPPQARQKATPKAHPPQ